VTEPSITEGRDSSIITIRSPHPQRTSEYLPFEYGYASSILSSHDYHALINEYGIRWIVNNQDGWKSGGAAHRHAPVRRCWCAGA